MHAPSIKTILLLDDEPAVLQIAAMILRRSGEWKVLEASSLQEAINHARSHIDLVIADVCVDEQAPSAVVRQLRMFYPHVPVLFMSGYPEDQLRGDGLITEGAAFLGKPFSPDSLVRSVRAEIAGPLTFRAAS